MDRKEFARKVMAETGQSINQIELMVAMNWYWTHRPQLAADAWIAAGEFVGAMKRVYEQRYGQRPTDIEDQPADSD